MSYHGVSGFGSKALAPVGRSQAVEEVAFGGIVEEAVAAKPDERLPSFKAYRILSVALRLKERLVLFDLVGDKVAGDDLIIEQITPHLWHRPEVMKGVQVFGGVGPK